MNGTFNVYDREFPCLLTSVFFAVLFIGLPFCIFLSIIQRNTNTGHGHTHCMNEFIYIYINLSHFRSV